MIEKMDDVLFEARSGLHRRLTLKAYAEGEKYPNERDPDFDSNIPERFAVKSVLPGTSRLQLRL